MNSSWKTWLTPRWLGLFGLCLFSLVAVISNSKVAVPILANLIPVILVVGILILILWAVISYIARQIAPKPERTSVENRLDELERLKRRDMVTPEEYATKRQEILKDL